MRWNNKIAATSQLKLMALIMALSQRWKFSYSGAFMSLASIRGIDEKLSTHQGDFPMLNTPVV